MADDISLLQEIDESLRAEKLQQFWQRFGNLVIGGCVGIVLFTVVWVVWKNHMNEVHAKQTDILLQVQMQMRDGKFSDAAATLETVKDSGGLAMLAGIARAQALLESGQKDKARLEFERVANMSADKGLRDYAFVQAAAIGAAMPALDKDSAYAHMSDEMQAVQLLNAGKRKDAQMLLSRIAEDEKTPPSERARAMELLDLASEE